MSVRDPTGKLPQYFNRLRKINLEKSWSAQQNAYHLAFTFDSISDKLMVSFDNKSQTPPPPPLSLSLSTDFTRDCRVHDLKLDTSTTAALSRYDLNYTERPNLQMSTISLIYSLRVHTVIWTSISCITDKSVFLEKKLFFYHFHT